MFVGHIGVALAAKGLAPKTSLPMLILAAQSLDVLWLIFLMAGVEHARIEPGYTAVSPLVFYYFPFSHSLAAALAWAAAFGVAYFFIRRDSWGGWVLTVLVLIHWPLDFIVHRPDLQLYPGDADHYGYALWDSVEHTLLLEGTIFLLGIVLYLGATRAKDDIGIFAFWSLMLLLGLLWLGSIYGPPPPTMTVVAVAGLAGMLLIFAWAGWIDRHRVAARS